jgi:hypothetical protein
MMQNAELKEKLNLIDRFIYATKEQPDTKAAFEFLLGFAETKYHEKIDQIKNG